MRYDTNLHTKVTENAIGVGDGEGAGRRGHQNFGENMFGQLLRKIRAFLGQNHVKFGNFVNFSGKYYKNSDILLLFRAKLM